MTPLELYRSRCKAALANHENNLSELNQGTFMVPDGMKEDFDAELKSAWDAYAFETHHLWMYSDSQDVANAKKALGKSKDFATEAVRELNR